jgi:hypothetical protein
LILFVLKNEDQRVSTSSSDEEIDTLYFSVRYDYSPTSSNESEMAMSWTSGLSPESSPRSHVYGISESDSDDYSPVCSEVDPTDFPLPSTAEDEESLNPDLDKNSDVPSEAELPGTAAPTLQNHCETPVFRFRHHFQHHQTGRGEVGDGDR